jgi:hypothetical protein
MIMKMSHSDIKNKQQDDFSGEESKKDNPTKKLDDTRKRELIAKIERTFNLLESVSLKMDTLNFDSFDVLFPVLLTNMKEAAILREELINELGLEFLIKISPQLFSTAKLIEEKYDNIVKIYTLETKKLKKELSVVGNQQKITNYLRY